ncbi:MAG: winged helix-turn-helix transcriptional regulator [Chloroflexota bacterium]|nr:winged helix-turn-helix transcriptional regulator [Chloroflexota bacterium]
MRAATRRANDPDDRHAQASILPARDATLDAAPDLPNFSDLSARFFRALGDPTRLRVLQLLLDAPAGEVSVSELVEALDAPQSRVSTHLGCLRWCGLVRARREGKQVYYRVNDPRVREILTLGGAMIRDHAAGIASCEVVG